VTSCEILKAFIANTKGKWALRKSLSADALPAYGVARMGVKHSMQYLQT